MKQQTPHHQHKISGLFISILGGLVTLMLVFLNYYQGFDINSQLVYAPLLITALLVYGNKVLFYVFVRSGNLFAKYFLKKEERKLNN